LLLVDRIPLDVLADLSGTNGAITAVASAIQSGIRWSGGACPRAWQDHELNHGDDLVDREGDHGAYHRCGCKVERALLADDDRLEDDEHDVGEA
jgi:hypothetical protein